jgi:hypothetical protein
MPRVGPKITSPIGQVSHLACQARLSPFIKLLVVG